MAEAVLVCSDSDDDTAGGCIRRRSGPRGCSNSRRERALAGRSLLHHCLQVRAEATLGCRGRSAVAQNTHSS